MRDRSGCMRRTKSTVDLIWFDFVVVVLMMLLLVDGGSVGGGSSEDFSHVSAFYDFSRHWQLGLNERLTTHQCSLRSVVVTETETGGWLRAYW